MDVVCNEKASSKEELEHVHHHTSCMHALQHERNQGVGMDALAIHALENGRNFGMRSSMEVIREQAWMVCERDVVEHGCNDHVGMDVVKTRCCRGWKYSGAALGQGRHGCSGHRMHFSGRDHGVCMDELGNGCTRK